MKFICAYCGKEGDKFTSYVNRANKLGLKVYCNRECSGLGRRHNKTTEQKKVEKAEYDKQYRYYHKEGIKERKAAAFKKDYAANPEKYRKERQRRMSAHIEYCRKPEYREKKKAYDHDNHAKVKYGEFWECAQLLYELETYIDNRFAKQQNNLINKSTKRKRLWTKKHNQLDLLPRI